MRKISYLFVFVVLLCSCSERRLIEQQQQGDADNPMAVLSEIPFADPVMLASFAGDDYIVDFNLARKIAFVDMTINGYFERHGWVGCHLSQVPVTIFGFDNRPFLYDFIVLDDKETPRGTVTVRARRESAMQIYAISGDVMNYRAAFSKSKGASSGLEFFADHTGRRYVAGLTKSSGAIVGAVDVATGESVGSLEYMEDLEILRRMRDEVLPMVCGSEALAREVADTMELNMIRKHRSSEAFWAATESYEAALLSMPEAAASAAGMGATPFGKVVDDGDIVIGPPTPPRPTQKLLTVDTDGGDLAWIREYLNRFKTYEIFNNSFCGPWIAGYILTTNYDKYIDSYRFDQEGYTVQGGEFRGAMSAPCLHFALRDYSGGKMGINLNASSQEKTYWRIRNEARTSVRMLANWQGFDTQWHWTVLYGSYRIPRFITTSYYFMQADNGATIPTYGRNNHNPRYVPNYNELQWFDTLFEVEELNTYPQ